MPTIAARPAVRVRRPSAPPARRRAGGRAENPDLRRRTNDVPVGEESLAFRIKGWGERVNGSSLLDAIIYRRLWIPVLAVALIGIVAMQVATLGINAGIGRTVDRSVLLERENTVLAAEVSRLESADRLSSAVAGMGMVDPVAGSTRYLRADGSVLADASAPSADTTPAEAQTAPVADPVASAPQQAAAPVAQPATPTPAAAPVASAQPVQQAAPAVAPTVAPAAAPTVAPPAAAASGGAVAGGATAPIAPTAAVGIR